MEAFLDVFLLAVGRFLGWIVLYVWAYECGKFCRTAQLPPLLWCPILAAMIVGVRIAIVVDHDNIRWPYEFGLWTVAMAVCFSSWHKMRRVKILRERHKFPSDVSRCENCAGGGISHYRYEDDWDNDEPLCRTCKGLGFLFHITLPKLSEPADQASQPETPPTSPKGSVTRLPGLFDALLPENERRKPKDD